jgi:pimeloyl-ACP methyl ester carboxylesterase
MQPYQPSASIRLADGRALSYAEYGHPQGPPVFIFHGQPGSRFDGKFIPALSGEGPQPRIIMPERPGIGRSDPLPGRTFIDWPKDVQALAHALGLDRFVVVGASGGTPYAAACALAMPERVTRLGLISVVGPFDVPGLTTGMGPGKQIFQLAARLPWLVRLQYGMMASGAAKTPQKFLQQARGTLSTADQAVFENPELQEGFLETIKAGLENGSAGMTYDAGLYARPWKMDLPAIRVPTFIYHGEDDKNAPVAMARYLAETIPGAQARIFPGEGHFSTVVRYTGAFLKTLLENEH